MATAAPSTIIFHDNSDWRHWNNIFTDKVEAAGLKEVIFGDDSLMEKPPRKPQFSDYPRDPKLPALPEPEGSASIETVEGNTQPQEPRAQEMDDLKKADRDTINARFACYDRDMKQWTWELKVVGELKNWLRSSLEPSLIDTLAPSGSSLKQWYQNIRESALPEQKLEKRKVHTEYKEHLASITKAMKRIPEWLTRWQTLLLKGKQVGVVACEDPETWYPDLMEAIQKVPSLETFHFTADANYEPQILAGRMTAAQYVVEIKRAYEKANPQHRKTPRSAAFPSLHGRGDSSDENAETDDSSKRKPQSRAQQLPHEPKPSRIPPSGGDDASSDEPGRGRSQKKRPRADTKPRSRSASRPRPGAQEKKRVKFDKKIEKNTEGYSAECLGCYNAHKLKDCYYVFPDLAHYDFFFRHDKKKLVEFRMANDLELQKAVAEINKKRNAQH